MSHYLSTNHYKLENHQIRIKLIEVLTFYLLMALLKILVQKFFKTKEMIFKSKTKYIQKSEKNFLKVVWHFINRTRPGIELQLLKNNQRLWLWMVQISQCLAINIEASKKNYYSTYQD
jgi:hypothetical protein